MSGSVTWWMSVTEAEAAEALPFAGEEPGALDVVATGISDGRTLLARTNDALFDARTAVTAAWLGSTAAIGEAEVDRLLAATAVGVDRLDQARSAVLDYSDEITGVRASIERLRDDWQTAEHRVRVAAHSLETCQLPTELPALQVELDLAITRRDGVQRSWRHEVARANRATLDCAERLRRSLEGDQVYVPGRGVVSEDLAAALGTDQLMVDDLARDSGDPAAQWEHLSSSAQAFALVAAGVLPAAAGHRAVLDQAWRSRTPIQQQALIHADPGGIGALDGVPAAARDQANRLALSRQEAALATALAALPADTRRPGWDAYRSPELLAVDVERDRLTTEMANLQTLRDQLGPAAPPRLLLAFELSGRGQAVVALGDPDRAGAVATYVPGTGSDLGGLSRELDRSTVMLAEAASAGAAATSVIAWVGYASPATVPDAAYDRSADDGAARLVAFQDGLRASHLGTPSLNTVVGYSYGAFLVGTAATGPDGLDADQLVFIAGAGLEIESVDQLHLTGVPPEHIADRVFAVAYDNDIILATGSAHSGLPTDPEFGASVFGVGEYATEGPGLPWVGVISPALGRVLGPSVAAHSTGNWKRGSGPMVGTGAVIAGRRPPGEVRRR